MLDLLWEGKTLLCTVRSYWSEQFIAGNKTEKLSDESPTDQERRPGDRADQAHRVWLTARSISFASLSDALSLVGLTSQFSFLFTVPSKSAILKWYILLTAVVIYTVDIITCSSNVCL